MKKILLFSCTICMLMAQHTLAQDIQTFDNKSPYHTSFKVDAPIIVGGIGLTALGVSFIDKKDSLTIPEMNLKTVDKIPFFDRSNAGFYSDKANDDSYPPFFAAFAMPVVMMVADKDQRQKAGQVLVLYTETMAITGAMFSLSAGLINRSRPLVYSSTENPADSDAPLDKRLSKNSQRSFYAGHVAATSAASFFAAKVFQDFHPDSKLVPYVWGLSAATSGLVGYLRYKAGQHFLSDVLLGYAIGGATGILVPQLHKSKIMENVSIYPNAGNGYKGVSVVYHITYPDKGK